MQIGMIGLGRMGGNVPVRLDHVSSVIVNADHGTVLRGYDIYAEKEPA